MTTLAPSPVQLDDIPVGTHRVEVRGDKVVVFDVELFAGYDPAVDDQKGDAERERMQEWTESKVRDAVARTKFYMTERGQSPQIVVEHETDGRHTQTTSVGDVLDVRFEMRDGVAYVVGDIEFSRWKFDAFIASNDYPRRSAEIWRDGFMSEIALLGRDTPARPLPDLKFSAAEKPERFTRRCAALTFDAVSPGPGNTNVPELVKDESAMGDTNPDDDRFARFEAMLGSVMKRLNALDGGGMDDDDKSDNAQPVDGKATFERQIADLTSANATLTSQNEDLAGIVGELVAEVKTQKFDRELDAMEAEGYRIGDQRASMKKHLLAAGGEEGEKELLQLFRSSIARDPVGRRVALDNVESRVGDGISDAQKLVAASAEIREEMTAEGKFDRNEFNRRLAKRAAELTKGA